MKIGFLGTGRILKKVMPTLKRIKEIECYAIASRSMERATAAAEEHDIPIAYGSYEELVQDEAVELVYIVTPHSRHFEDMKLCIAHGKPVLCEKAFTINATQAKEIEKLSREKGVFVAEAMWTRYMPSRQLIQEIIDSGIIGNITTLTANLSYVVAHKKRIMEPELAGGALLDLGVYGLNFAYMHFGAEIDRIESSVLFTETGVDAMESITLFYKDGRMAVLTHSIYTRSDRQGVFHGDKGYIVVDNINNPLKISVFDVNDTLIKEIQAPEQISGYEYQFLECMDKIKNHEMESDSSPLRDSVFVMEMADTVRKQWGFVYPQEQ